MPLFTLSLKTGKRGMMRRNCTERYKIQPIHRFIRTLWKRSVVVEQWFGISTDERQRERIVVRNGRLTYLPRYPLIYDVPMSRADCLAYLEAMGISAPKSACVACPYRSREQWQVIRADPVAWSEAVAFDHAIRRMPDAASLLFLHPMRIPLDEVPFDDPATVTRFEREGFLNECQGMCGT